MTKTLKRNSGNTKRSECLMRQRKLNSDLLIVLDKPEEEIHEKDEKGIYENSQSLPSPLYSPLTPTHGVPFFQNSSGPIGMTGMAMYLDQELSYCKLKTD